MSSFHALVLSGVEISPEMLQLVTDQDVELLSLVARAHIDGCPQIVWGDDALDSTLATVALEMLSPSSAVPRPDHITTAAQHMEKHLALEILGLMLLKQMTR